MNSLKPLGIAVWGLGGHAWKSILPAILISNAVKLVGVYTRNVANAEQAIRIFGGKAWQTAHDMLTDQAVDVVYVATPTGLHFEHGMMVLGAGKNLLCEKSLTHDAKKSLQLIGCAEKKDLVLLEAFMYLYHPQFLTALNIIMQPEFGKILSVSSNFGIPELPKSSFRTSKELGGGAFLDVGCYPISAVLSIIKKLPKILQFTTAKDRRSDIDISGSATLSFSSGITAFLDWGYDRAYRAELMVWGEKQSLYMEHAFSKKDNYEAKVLLSDKCGNSAPILVKPANSFVEMFEVFRKAVDDQEERKKLWDFATQQAKAVELFQSKIGIDDDQ